MGSALLRHPAANAVAREAVDRVLAGRTRMEVEQAVVERTGAAPPRRGGSAAAPHRLELANPAGARCGFDGLVRVARGACAGGWGATEAMRPREGLACPTRPHMTARG